MFDFDFFPAIGVLPVPALDAHQHVSQHASFKSADIGDVTLDISIMDNPPPTK